MTNGFYGHSRGKVGHELLKRDGVCSEGKTPEGREDKGSSSDYPINSTKNVQSGGILNLQKGYEMHPISSGFNGYSERC